MTNAERDLKEAQTNLAQAKKFRAQLPSIAQQTKIEKTYDELTELGESIDELVDEAELESENVDEIKESLADARKESVRLATEGKNIDKSLLSAQNEVADFGSARAVADGLDVCDDLDEILADMEKQMQRLVKSEGQVKQAKTEFERQLAKSGYVNEKKAEASLLIEKPSMTSKKLSRNKLNVKRQLDSSKPQLVTHHFRRLVLTSRFLMRNS